MHPLLVPGSWLLDGRYYPAGRSAQHVAGVTEVHPSEEFPESLRVDGEVRDVERLAARPVRSTFHLDVTGPSTVRFRMDSAPLGTVLTGEGYFDDDTLVLRYASPDRRILGVETFVRCASEQIRSTGVLMADGAPVTSWLATLERVTGSLGKRRS